MSLFKRRKDLGVVLLAVWLIAHGVLSIISIPFATPLLGLLAIAAGTLILVDR